MTNTARMIELLEQIKGLAIKGLPGYYVSKSFVPNETVAISIDAQERFFLINSLRSDLPIMKLSEKEKSELSGYLDELHGLTFQEESGRIFLDSLKKIDSELNKIIDNQGEKL